MFRVLRPLAGFIVVIVPILAVAVVKGQEKISYNRDIRPILSNACFQCHGMDANAREAGLRLDTASGALGDSDDGSGAIVPGDLGNSLLWERVTADEPDDRMPPPDSGKELTAEQIDLLKLWIEQGADYEPHWAFVPPQAAPLPPTKNRSWPRNEIDHFVLATLERNQLAPSAAASKRELIRRVSFDLTGLPPTPAEIQEFLADESGNAYENMLDRYLASPSFGEHMAGHWLDLARYADSNGYQYDTERSMWVWRDWVINAFNQNMPYDQFTIEQIAGDLLPDATNQQILATGFNRNHPITIEGGVIDEEYRTEYVIDRLNTTATVWMGLTIGCARCHDHKYDPVSQREFYQLAAFFNQVPERGLNGFEPTAQIASPLAEPLSRERQIEIAELRQQIDELGQPPTDKQLEGWAEEIAQLTAPRWEVLELDAIESSGGATLTLQADNSVLASGTNPAQDTYRLKANSDLTRITAIRLECLLHDSLPGKGPGRHSNSNFLLSEFELAVRDQREQVDLTPVRFARAAADYSQNGYDISQAIDGKLANNNGWAVNGPNRKLPATAVFFPENPLEFEAGAQLEFRLRHVSSFPQHGIGRFRISLAQSDMRDFDFTQPSAQLISVANKDPSQRSTAEHQLLLGQFTLKREEKRNSLESQLESLLPAAKYPKTMIMRDRPSPRPTFVLERGQYDLKGAQVEPDVPRVLGQMPADLPRNRLGLARWLVDPSHPLTSRVAVNRIWQLLFGRGLVASPEDFGLQGAWPSHPELLDQLAVDFVANGWDVKHLLRRIMLSATYRQSSRIEEVHLSLDPTNRWLARAPRRRLSAEQIRDQALAVSGLLNQKLGGPSVFPYQPSGLWLELNNRPGFSKEYEPSTGPALYRRSLYTYWKRTVLSPMLNTFDAPSREFCTVQRSTTNTPLQSLLLLQAPQFVEAARHLAARLVNESGNTDSRIQLGFELVTSRPPTARELQIVKEFFESELERFERKPDLAVRALQVGDSAQDARISPVEQAAWMSVARLLLNLDESINRG